MCLRVSAAAPEYSGVLTATVFLSSTEEMLDSGLLLVDADDFANVNLSAAAPESSGVLTAPIVVFVRGGARLGSSACRCRLLILPMGVVWSRRRRRDSMRRTQSQHGGGPDKVTWRS